MERSGKYMYLGLPVLGSLFYLLYLYTASIDMVYSDYIRLIQSYLPDVWNPEKFFVPDLLTRIPVNYLERAVNVTWFGYSVMFDRLLGVLGFGLSALCIGSYARRHSLGMGWYTVMMLVMFSLNKWEMLYNGTGWAHFLAFACFFYNYLVFDRVYSGRGKKGDMRRLFFLPAVITIGVAGPYCAIYSMTLILAALFVIAGKRLLVRRISGQAGARPEKGRAFNRPEKGRISNMQAAGIIFCTVWPLIAYMWSDSQAVYEHSGAVEIPLMTALGQQPEFFLKFFLKSFASMIFGVELIHRRMSQVPDMVWCLAGLLVLGSYVLALWMNFRYGLAEKTILPLMLLAGGGMNHLLVLASRWIFMPNDSYGMSSRYALQYQVGILGILLTFALVWKQSKDNNTHCPRAVREMAVTAAGVLLAGNLLTTAEEFSFGKHRKYHNEMEVKEIVLNFENETDDTLKAALEYRKDGIREALTILKENGWNIFGDNSKSPTP